MNFDSYALPALLLAVAGNAGANPASSPSTAPPSAVVTAPDVAVSPAPGFQAVGSQAEPVRLLPAMAPAVPSAAAVSADNCDTADCLGGGGKSAAKPVHIGPAAQRALSESREWAENPDAMPLRDAGGHVVFMFGQSVPTIVCAPIHVCDIELQAGEVVQGTPHVGDAVRWRISPAVSGSDEKRVIHLIVKPTEAGLDTNLIVPTDRHTYHLRLVSSTARYVSSVAFYYPAEQQKEWTDVAKEARHGGANGNDAGGDLPTLAVNRLNFNYRIKVVKGRPSFRPLRAMDDGYHTYVSMNEDLTQQEAPVPIGITANGAEQMINYRLKGNLYIIDGTLAKLAFVSGVGREQQRVELTRDPCKTRGWLGICWDAQE